ncbi:hypothetical protein [Pseudalkalibacillus salsuginis]|uniref:hypothetical protein n=1 Tax=Pseudalkalibacillus salsuginis TaxID=2910972 RepID=UPI001F239113|nr:hypothetical protein [Pseudalkalibacillus salsuginis]MCF6409283.1 hypothetical protein [Pseudalkalibacillus salsuginis]
MIHSSALRYIIYLILYSALLITGFKTEELLHVKATESFLLTPVFYYSILFPILVGMLLAFPLGDFSLKKSRNLKISWEKLLIFGIPSLLVLLFPAYYFSLFGWGDLIPFADLLYGNQKLHFFAGIVFGFTIVYSIDEKEQSEDDPGKEEG